MPEAIWLLSIGLYPIQRRDATPSIGDRLLGANRQEIGLFLLSESGP
jgi:hypothetical protein